MLRCVMLCCATGGEGEEALGAAAEEQGGLVPAGWFAQGCFRALQVCHGTQQGSRRCHLVSCSGGQRKLSRLLHHFRPVWHPGRDDPLEQQLQHQLCLRQLGVCCASALSA